MILVKSEKQIVEAMRSPKVKMLGDKEIEISIAKMLLKLNADSGFDLSATDMNHMAATMKTDVKRGYGRYTLKDIENCFYMGLRGEFGKFYGLNVKTLNEWLRAYEEIWLGVKKKVELAEPKEEKQLPYPDEKLYLTVIEQIEKENDRWPDFVTEGVYRHLISIKELDESKMDKNEIVNPFSL